MTSAPQVSLRDCRKKNDSNSVGDCRVGLLDHTNKKVKFKSIFQIDKKLQEFYLLQKCLQTIRPVIKGRQSQLLISSYIN